LTGKRVAADGTTTTESFAAMYDGKDTPLDLAVTGATRVLNFEGLRKDEAESVYCSRSAQYRVLVRSKISGKSSLNGLSSASSFYVELRMLRGFAGQKHVHW
jgi:hypothetical protein